MTLTLTSLRDLRNDTLYRLGDSDNRVWSTDRIDSYLLMGLGLFCIQTNLLWERTYLDNVVGQAVYRVPENYYSLERTTWHWRVLSGISSVQIEMFDKRYQITQGEVYAYTLDKDGLRNIRLIRVPASAASAFTYQNQAGKIPITGLFGAPRKIGDVTTATFAAAGWTILTGFNSKIDITGTLGGIPTDASVNIAPANYSTGAALAAALTAVLNPASGVSVAYSTVTQKFTFTLGGGGFFDTFTVSTDRTQSPAAAEFGFFTAPHAEGATQVSDVAVGQSIDRPVTNYYGVARQFSDQDAFGGISAGGSYPYGCPRRFFRDEFNTKLEYYRAPFLPQTEDDTIELPHRYLKVIRFYASWKAYEMEGPGQNLKMAEHYKGRWQDGIKRAQKHRESLRDNRVGRMGGPTEPRGAPPRPMRPWQYGRIVK